MKKLKEEKCFKYLRVDMAANGTTETEVSHRVSERAKNMWYERSLSGRAKMRMFEGIVDNVMNARDGI